ncbi:beta-lactamase-like protein [Lenzites betulinus]|nr:beta-lactamase-like protein [Lenzites betulinus]
MITFTPLSGAAGTIRSTPLAYLLQVDDVRILLDCGSPDWCPEPSPEDVDVDAAPAAPSWEKYCDALKECASSVDLVLLSHGDLSHTGLYPYAHAHWGLTAPAYTTLPVQAMARIAATEDVESIRDEQPVEGTLEASALSSGVDGSASPPANGTSPSPPSDSPPVSYAGKHKYVATIQQVHDAFDSVNVLRYSQPCHLQGKCQGLTIIPFNAGHTLGGTIWKIRSPSAGTILYAVDMNHMRERHLDGTVLIRQASAGGGVFESLARPDLLITDAERANVTTARRKDRDSALLDCVTATLSSRNSLLLPCDSSTRVLELLVLLDQHWNYSRLKYPICLLSRTGREMLTFVRSMMEWLGGTISKEDVGEDGAGHGRDRRRRDEDNDDEALGAFALRFRHLEFFPSPQLLMQTYSSKEPKLILAVPATLSHGPSRSLFSQFAEIPDNVVLLTGRSEPGTLGRLLFDKWNNSQREEAKWDRGRIGSNIMMDGELRLEMHSKVPLQGAELEEFLAKERALREKEAVQQAALARSQRMLEADEGQSDSDSDSDNDSDDSEENEVERTLGDDLMDTTDEVKRAREGPNASSRSGTKRKRGDGGGGDGADWALGNDPDDGVTRISFDIYLKGHVAKTTSFFKSAEGQTQRFRMFPYVEKKRKVDEYGETVDVGMWLRKGRVLEEDAEDEEAKEARRRKEEEEAKKAPREPPSKFVTSIAEVQLACRLFFVDLEGLNDGRAVKTIVPQVNPRKMILIHAPQAATESLIESCANIRAMTKEIYAPAQGETVQIGQQTNSFSISLSDELLASIKMSRFEDNEVGYVTGRISNLATATIPVLQPVSLGSLQPQTHNPLPVEARILGSRARQPLPQSTMIGELKLTALKTRLAQVGVQAELVGEGVLICGAAAKKGASADALQESVAVRKTARGRVELEGSISDVYYKVRKEIYALHALVAA